MSERKRLFLIDGSALAYRSYFAFVRNPLINSKGENTSAPFGFTNTLLKLLREYEPDYLAVVFDTGKPTFRHKRFAEYKATRQKMPDEMREQIPRIYEVVEAMRVPVLEEEGFEADDVIGTLARQASGRGIECVLVTGDKDFMQLVSPAIKILNPRKAGSEIELIDEAGVVERMGVPPSRVTDVLGLMGDSSDNVPGVPKVGPKTAVSLIQEYSDLEVVLASADRVRGRAVQENLKAYADQARLSKELVTIDTEVPVELDLDAMAVKGFDTGALSELFKELEFNRFLQEITSEEEQVQVVYETVSTEDVLDQLLTEIADRPMICVDVETTDIDPMRAEIVGISLAAEPFRAYYIPVGHREGPNLDRDRVLEKLRPVLEDPSVPKCGQNVKYDTMVFLRAGIRPRGFAFDTMIASYLIDPSARQHNLDALSLRYLNHKMIPISDLIGTGKKQISFAEAPVDRAAAYSCEDADVTLRLKELLEQNLDEFQVAGLFRDIEMPLVEILRRMEEVGVCVDVDLLSEMSVHLEAQLDGLMTEIYEEAEEEFNINSTQQLGRILFEKLGLPHRRKTKTGYSTDVRVLEELAETHPLPRLLLEYRQIMKLKSTYVDALPKMIHPETGRIHTSFNQTITATGRLSSSDPNLQNIPIRTDIGREIRRAFVPADPSWVLLSADYSQIELRIMAHLSGDETLTASFAADEDVHTRTASLLFGVFPEIVDEDMRRQAKTINYGVMYGMGRYGLSRQLGISAFEAQQFIDSYFATYPGVARYVEETIRQARKDGFVTTLRGRRRYLPEINSKNTRVREFSERTAVNTPIQGSSADLIKIAMINLSRRMDEENLRTRMILQVHDELVFEVPKDEVDRVRELVVREMEGALRLSVPVKVDVGIGSNWLEAH